MKLELSETSLENLAQCALGAKSRDETRHPCRSGGALLPDKSPTLLDRKEAAEFLNSHGYRTAPRTLAKLACIGGGPAFRHFGRRVRYEPPALLKWAEERLSPPRTSTSMVAFREHVGSRHGVHNAALPAASASRIGTALIKTRIERRREEVD